MCIAGDAVACRNSIDELRPHILVPAVLTDHIAQGIIVELIIELPYFADLVGLYRQKDVYEALLICSCTLGGPLISSQSNWARGL